MIEQRLKTDWESIYNRGRCSPQRAIPSVGRWRDDRGTQYGYINLPYYIYIYISLPVIECIVSLSAINVAVDRMWVRWWLCRIQMRFKIEMRKYLILFEGMLICFRLDYLCDNMYDWSRCDQLKRWERSEVKERCLKDEGWMSAGGRRGSYLLQADVIEKLG